MTSSGLSTLFDPSPTSYQDSNFPSQQLPFIHHLNISPMRSMAKGPSQNGQPAQITRPLAPRVLYLALYNTILCFLWTSIFMIVINHTLNGKSNVFDATSSRIRWIQTLSFVEVVHAATGTFWPSNLSRFHEPLFIILKELLRVRCPQHSSRTLRGWCRFGFGISSLPLPRPRMPISLWCSHGVLQIA
jgi:hypothetical protein